MTEGFSKNSIHRTYIRHNTRSDYKARILGSKIEEFPCSVHKLSVILTALQYKPHWKMGLEIIQTAGYDSARTVNDIPT